MPRRPMGFGLRGLEIALANRTARGWDGAGRASCGRTCEADTTAGGLASSPPGSRAGTWAAHVLAKPLLGNAGVAVDVAPGPARVLVRVPAVVVVAGA